MAPANLPRLDETESRQLGDELVELDTAGTNARVGFLQCFVERLGVARVMHVHDNVVSPGIAAALAAATDSDPGRRFPSVRAFREALFIAI